MIDVKNLQMLMTEAKKYTHNIESKDVLSDNHHFDYGLQLSIFFKW